MKGRKRKGKRERKRRKGGKRRKRRLVHGAENCVKNKKKKDHPLYFAQFGGGAIWG